MYQKDNAYLKRKNALGSHSLTLCCHAGINYCTYMFLVPDLLAHMTAPPGIVTTHPWFSFISLYNKIASKFLQCGGHQANLWYREDVADTVPVSRELIVLLVRDTKQVVKDFLLLLFTYSWETHTQRQRQTEGEAGSLQGVQMWDSIPGPGDHTQSRRQMLTHWATQVPPLGYFCLSFTNEETQAGVSGIGHMACGRARIGIDRICWYLTPGCFSITSQLWSESLTFSSDKRSRKIKASDYISI